MSTWSKKTCAGCRGDSGKPVRFRTVPIRSNQKLSIGYRLCEDCAPLWKDNGHVVEAIR